VTVVLVFLGAVIGAPTRYLTDRAVQSRHDSVFPWGTLTANLIGCLILGGLAGAGAALPAEWLALAGTGFCGALTTYSTFSYESVRLIEQRCYFYAFANALTTLIAGLGAAALAYTTIHAAVA
jgi:CrcB protein